MDNRIFVITGASSGIGAATAIKLAGRCRGMVLHARKSAGALQAVADMVAAAGTETVMHLGDLSDRSLASGLVDCARERFGRLDGVVANAGFPILKSMDEGGWDDLEHAFHGNVFSFFSIVKEAAALLAQSDAGRVVAVGSFTSHVFRTDIRSFPLSASSKGALETAVKSLALHLASKSVTVNCVVPGLIEKGAGTEDSLPRDELEASCLKVPLGRIGRPDDVAAAIDFLLSIDAGYITGQSLHVNGGLV
jgi:3-oxoacyl-[acyl-carrier protein] reductase